MTKQCVICGKKFEVFGNSKTCSISCKLKRYDQHRNKWENAHPEYKNTYASFWRERNRSKLRQYNSEWSKKRKPQNALRARLYRTRLKITNPKRYQLFLDKRRVYGNRYYHNIIRFNHSIQAIKNLVALTSIAGKINELTRKD